VIVAAVMPVAMTGVHIGGADACSDGGGQLMIAGMPVAMAGGH
jgi:hypothetical protein